MTTPRKPTTVAGRRRPKAETQPEARRAGDMRAAFEDRTKPTMVNTSFNFPEDFHDHLRRIAFDQKMSMRDVLVSAVLAQHPMN